MRTSVSLRAPVEFAGAEAWYQPYKLLFFGSAARFAQLRDLSDVVGDFAHVRVAVNGVPRTVQLQRFEGLSDKYLAERAGWGDGCVVVCERDTDTTALERLIVALRANYMCRRIVTRASALDENARRYPLLVVGASAAARETGYREECVVVDAVTHADLFVHLVGAVDLARPSANLDAFLDQRQRTVDRLAQVMEDPIKLAELNNSLKGGDCKGALDLYLATSTGATDEAALETAELVYQRYVEQRRFPYLLSFLLTVQLRDAPSTIRARAALLSIQEEVLHVLHPYVVSERASGVLAPQPTSPRLAPRSSSSVPVKGKALHRSGGSDGPKTLRSVLVMHRRELLSPAEINVVLEESRWPLLRTLLLRAIADEESEKRDEALFAWEACEKVVTVHLLAPTFGAWLAATDVRNCKAAMRLFREDTPATRWLHRRWVAQQAMYAPSLVPAVRNMLASTASVALGDQDALAARQLLLPFFDALFALRLDLDLMCALTQVRDECELRGIHATPVLGRLVMLRWVGPFVTDATNYESVMGELSPAQRASLLLLSRLCVALAERSALQEAPDASNPLIPLFPFLASLEAGFCAFLQANLEEESVARAMRQMDGAAAVTARKKRSFALYIESLRLNLLLAGCDPALLE